MKRLLVSLVVLALGCASSGSAKALAAAKAHEDEAEVTSPSGRAEISIPFVTKKSVLDALVERMTDSGYTVGNVSEYRAVFEKAGGFWADVLFGSDYNRSAV